MAMLVITSLPSRGWQAREAQPPCWHVRPVGSPAREIRGGRDPQVRISPEYTVLDQLSNHVEFGQEHCPQRSGGAAMACGVRRAGREVGNAGIEVAPIEAARRRRRRRWVPGRTCQGLVTVTVKAICRGDRHAVPTRMLGRSHRYSVGPW